MKAITYHRYGAPEVLGLEDVEVPEAGEGEILVRVRAASVNPRDWHFLRGDPYVMRLQFGVRRPRHTGLGSCVAGVVEATGPGTTAFAPGDEVMADVVTGGFAEYVAVAEDLVAPKPANVTFEEAAAVPLAALTALQGLRDRGRLQPGQHVLVVGAGGGVGTFAVQLGRWLGAEVTGVCSTAKAELVRSLGADRVIDYAEEDFTAAGPQWDLVFQLAGTAGPSACRRALRPGGTLLVGSGESDGHWIGPITRNLAARALSPLVSHRLLPFIARRSGEDLRTMTGLIEAGTVTPVVDRTYPLAAVPEAIRHLEEGHARGKIVISV